MSAISRRSRPRPTRSRAGSSRSRSNFPVIRTRVHLAGARAEVVAGRVVPVARHSVAQDAEVRVLLREAVRETLPARARVLRPPHRRLTVGHRAAMARIERDDMEGVAVVGMGCSGKPELRRQPFGDLRPRRAGIVRAMHADVVLLVHPLRIGG